MESLEPSGKRGIVSIALIAPSQVVLHLSHEKEKL